MGNNKQKTKRVAMQKYAQLKRCVSLKDNRINEKDRLIRKKKEDPTQLKVMEKPQQSSALFFSYNTQLGKHLSSHSFNPLLIDFFLL